MTLEDIYRKLCERAINDTSPLGWEVALVLKEELGDCIIIKKGENRHPYADVLHEWVEGAMVQTKLSRWVNCIKAEDLFSVNSEYRIKPSEPVYEYMWYDNKGNTRWFTEEESTKYAYQDLEDEHVYYIAEETKRERKNA